MLNAAKELGYVPNLAAMELASQKSKLIRQMNYPTVVLENSILTQNCSNINTDEVMWTYMATRYLIDCGHRRIAFINGSEQFEINRERLEGFRRVTEEVGFPVDDSNPILRPSSSRTI